MHDTYTALRALSAKFREGAEVGFPNRPKMTLTARQALVENALGIADEADALADEAKFRDIDRGAFDSLMVRFRALGKRPPNRWVNAVESSIAAAERRRGSH